MKIQIKVRISFEPLVGLFFAQLETRVRLPVSVLFYFLSLAVLSSEFLRHSMRQAKAVHCSMFTLPLFARERVNNFRQITVIYVARDRYVREIVLLRVQRSSWTRSHYTFGLCER